MNRTIDIMQANSLYRKSLAWSDIGQPVWLNLEPRQIPVVLMPPLKMALRMLGDHHSFITKANGEMIFGDSLSRSCAAPEKQNHRSQKMSVTSRLKETTKQIVRRRRTPQPKQLNYKAL